MLPRAAWTPVQGWGYGPSVLAVPTLLSLGLAVLASTADPLAGALALAEGSQCAEDGDCGGGQVCEDYLCVSVRSRGRSKVETDGGYDVSTRHDRGGSDSRFRMAPFLRFAPTLYSSESSGSDLSSFAAGLELDFGRSVHYHLAFGYQQVSTSVAFGGATVELDSISGVRIEPLTLGWPIQILDGFIRVEIEPVVGFLNAEVLFGEKITATLATSFAVRGVLHVGPAYAAIEPIAVNAKFLFVGQNVEGGLQLEWPVRILAGYEF